MTHLRALPDSPARPTSESLVARLARSPRAFTFDELCGLATPRKARTAIANGHIERILPDAYVAAVHAQSFTSRADAALLWAGPRASLSGPAAMHLWGFLPDPPALIDIVLPHPIHHQTPAWLRVRRINWAPPLSRVRGMTVVGPAHAIVLGYGKLPDRQRANAVHEAIRRRLVTARGLMEVLEAVPRVAARRELHQRLELAARGAQSYLEEKGLSTVFNTAEFARLIRQHEVMARGRTYRLDLFDSATMTAIELDGAEHHSEPSDRLRDIRRDADLASVGIQTIRLSFADVMQRPDWCRALVRGVLITRSAR